MDHPIPPGRLGSGLRWNPPAGPVRPEDGQYVTEMVDYLHNNGEGGRIGAGFACAYIHRSVSFLQPVNYLPLLALGLIERRTCRLTRLGQAVLRRIVDHERDSSLRCIRGGDFEPDDVEGMERAAVRTERRWRSVLRSNGMAVETEQAIPA